MAQRIDDTAIEQGRPSRPATMAGWWILVAAAGLGVFGPGIGAHEARAQAEVGECHVDEAPDKGSPHPDIHGLHEPETKENCDVDRIANDRERRRMEAYLAGYVREGDIVETLKLRSGEIIDCVDVYRQPALRRPGMEAHELQFRPRTEPDEAKE